MANRLQNALVGAAGEYHVAAQLSIRGWLATVTIKNAPGTDVLAQHANAKRLVAIQTKTTFLTGGSFVLNVKDEHPASRDDEWYVFVAMRGFEERPDFYILPRDHVAAMLWVGHRNWLATPGRAGQDHNDTPMRAIFPKEIPAYRERWDALLEDTARMPYALPDWFNRGVGTYGLPPGHRDAELFSSP